MAKIKAGKGKERKLTSLETDVRQAAALELTRDYGAGYFNPLIGESVDDTCGNISRVMQMLWQMLESKDLDHCEAQAGMQLVVQTVWSAAQHETHIGKVQLERYRLELKNKPAGKQSASAAS